MTIESNIAGRRKAEELLSLAEPSALEAKAFWQRIRAEVNKHLPPEPPPKPTIEPMSDAQARAFEMERMPFGKFAGCAVGSVATDNVGYLFWLADEPDEFRQRLKRYLANPTVSRELQGDE